MPVEIQAPQAAIPAMPAIPPPPNSGNSGNSDADARKSGGRPLLFDVQAALAEIMADNPATIATTATNRANVAKVAGVAAGSCEISAPATPPRGAVVLPLHGPDTPSAPRSMMRLGWSGEWVSRDRWDSMSDLERHGPQGRLFCGKCWRYRDHDTALACLEGEACL